MARFGRASEKQIATLSPGLQRVLHRAIKYPGIDFTVVQGHRSLEEQARLYAQGRTAPGPKVTNAKPGQSNHNLDPSPAVDVAPYYAGRIQWNDISAFNLVAAAILQAAVEEGVKIFWGGLWKTFKDRPHFEEIT